MTHSPDNDGRNLAKQDADVRDDTEQSFTETPRDLRNDTVPDQSGKPAPELLNAELPDDLSPGERSQATAALGFLKDVRAAVQSSEQLPRFIGRYTIVRSLGRGGFAEVFLAEDPELDRRVALKVPLFNAGLNDAARQRFEREARLAASLGHPQIVPVYEYGEVGPARFIAFAWCDGTTLSEWIKECGEVDFQTAAQIVLHLAEAVEHAHQRGIVHRDLKPGNVLVDASEDSADDPIWKRTRIADFGLARSNSVQETVLTQDGQILGTPAYMAPEQAESDSDVGPAADTWALGMMLFELLTGQLPFRRADMLATVRAISDESAPRVRSLREDVPAGLDAITDLCLRKAPADRYESAYELAEDLRRWLNRKPVKARPLSVWSRLKLWTQRNPLPAASLALTIASLGIGLSISLWQRDIAIQNLKEAQTQTQRADDNLQTAQTLINDIVALEKQLRTDSKFTNERTALVKRAAELQLQLVKDENPTPQVKYDTAMSLRELSLVLRQLQAWDAAAQNARHVLSLLDGIDQDPPAGISASSLYETRFEQRIMLVTCFNMTGQIDEALRLCDTSEAEPVPQGISPLQRATWLSEMLRGRSLVLQMKGNRAASAKDLQRAIKFFEDIDIPAEGKLRWNYFMCQCRLQMSLATDQVELNELESARQCYSASDTALAELRLLNLNHPVLIQTGAMLDFHRGTLHEKLQEWDSAIEHYKNCRSSNLSQFEQNPVVGNPANIYLLCSLCLCRSHVADGAADTAQQIAEETMKTSATFPKSILESAAYRDNARLLKSYLSTE